MPSKREIFINHVGQTGEIPLGLEVDHADGMYITDISGKRYLDMNSGISVSSLGHRHPKVISAIKSQLDSYMHTMVYGEHIQAPQTAFAELLCSHLDSSLDNVYYLMAGTEAIEAAMKLAKRHTGRPKIVACRYAYHGSTHGAESLRSDHDYSAAFMPLVPGVEFIDFNDPDSLSVIDHDTAAVIMEPVQAEAGVISPRSDFLQQVRQRCDETGSLMILDEIQTGFGRTGYLFAHQKYNVIPDAITIGKAMGGGMPIAALVANRALMSGFTRNPALGHISTFAGHPVCAAAAHATLCTLLDEQIILDVLRKEKLIHQHLQHPIIKAVRSDGLMMAVELTKRKYLKHVVGKCHELGLLVDWFLFNNRSFRLAPPLIISEDQIIQACEIFKTAMDYAQQRYD